MTTKESNNLDDFNDKYLKMSQLMIFLEKNGLTIKETGFGKIRREYIKGKEFEEIVNKNLDKVCTDINSIMSTKIDPKKDKDYMQLIYNQFASLDMMIKAIREEGDKKKIIRYLYPYEEMCYVYGCNCGRDHTNIDRDHERHLDKDKIKEFDNSFYYVIKINRSMKKIYFYLSLIIIGILMYALLPIWPYKMKLAVWWISYILLLLLLGLFAFRLIVYILFYIFGYDVWIFPDLNNEKLGVIDSFKRVISCDKRNEKWYTILLRIVIALILGYISFCVWKNPKLIDDAQKIIYEALRDFYFFGEDKLVNSWNTTAISVKHNYKSFKEIDDLI